MADILICHLFIRNQCKWAEQNGYENNGPLYEVYITDPTQTSNEDEFITEIYYPVKKK